MEKLRPDIRYIFSKDILKHRRASAEDATYINKGDTYEDEHIRIQAFWSYRCGYLLPDRPAGQTAVPCR